MLRGRPPLPLATALANGAALRNPERFVGRIDAEEHLDHIPLGMPPAHFEGYPLCVALWGEFVAFYPWLRESDRHLIELACILMADVRHAHMTCRESGKGEDGTHGLAANATFSQLRQILQLIGGTPATLHRVLPQAPKDDPKKDQPKRGARYTDWN